MSINTRQTMQERTYSLKDFEDYFDSEILRLYHGQDASNPQLQQTQKNSVQQQAIQQGKEPKQSQNPKQGQIRQKNIQ